MSMIFNRMTDMYTIESMSYDIDFDFDDEIELQTYKNYNTATVELYNDNGIFDFDFFISPDGLDWQELEYATKYYQSSDGATSEYTYDISEAQAIKLVLRNRPDEAVTPYPNNHVKITIEV